MFVFMMPLEAGRIKRKKDHFLTLYDSPRFPRTIWEQFRVRTAANGDAWIDVLRELMDQHGRKENRRRDRH